jgi:sialidase-1
MIWRRIKVLGVVASTVLPLGSLAGQPAVIEHVTVYKQTGVYGAFPSLYWAEEGGTLVSSFATRTTGSHYDGTGGSKTLVSTDCGRTWSGSDKNYLNPAYKGSDGAYIIPAVNGWRLVPEGAAAEFERAGIELHSSNHNTFYATGAQIRTSRDNGKTWRSVPVDMPHHAVLMAHNLSGYLSGRRGARLFAMYGKQIKGERDRVLFLRSTDYGTTWNIVPLEPEVANRSVGLNETALAELQDGRIVAMMRPDPDSMGFLYLSVSVDGGQTWSKPRQTSIWGYPAHLLVNGGRLIVSYGYRRRPMGVQVAQIDPDTLQVSNRLVLRQDAIARPGDVGYPITVSVGTNTFLSIYYITTEDRVTHIAATRWTSDVAKWNQVDWCR